MRLSRPVSANLIRQIPARRTLLRSASSLPRLVNFGRILNAAPFPANLIRHEPARRILLLSSSILPRLSSLDVSLMPPYSCQLDTAGARPEDTALVGQQTATLFHFKLRASQFTANLIR
jgi:hypothetical protein